jgi:hypothetical protein
MKDDRFVLEAKGNRHISMAKIDVMLVIISLPAFFSGNDVNGVD